MTGQFYMVKPPRPGTTACTTTPAPVLTYVRAGALYLSTTLPVWKCHTGGSRSIPTVTPVLTSVRRLRVARYTETTEDSDTTTDEPDTLHKTYESRTASRNWFHTRGPKPTFGPFAKANGRSICARWLGGPVSRWAEGRHIGDKPRMHIATSNASRRAVRRARRFSRPPHAASLGSEVLVGATYLTRCLGFSSPNVGRLASIAAVVSRITSSGVFWVTGMSNPRVTRRQVLLEQLVGALIWTISNSRSTCTHSPFHLLDNAVMSPSFRSWLVQSPSEAD